MSTISTTTRHLSVSMNIVIALAITLVVLLAFAVAPFVVAPKPAFIPVTGSQNAYFEYLHGEKTLYSNSVGANKALSAYHLGEKPLFVTRVDPSDALALFRFGETHMISPAEYALLIYRAGEKGIQ